MKALIEEGMVDALVAKDLSRIGRHNAKVLLFLDYLDDHNIRLMLKSDNYDSNSDDDTMLGIRAWYKDLSKKITANIRQKQKEGLVIVQHYGYMKDESDKNKLVIDEDVAGDHQADLQSLPGGLRLQQNRQLPQPTRVRDPDV